MFVYMFFIFSFCSLYVFHVCRVVHGVHEYLHQHVETHFAHIWIRTPAANKLCVQFLLSSSNGPAGHSRQLRARQFNTRKKVLLLLLLVLLLLLHLFCPCRRVSVPFWLHGARSGCAALRLSWRARNYRIQIVRPRARTRTHAHTHVHVHLHAHAHTHAHANAHAHTYANAHIHTLTRTRTRTRVRTRTRTRTQRIYVMCV